MVQRLLLVIDGINTWVGKAFAWCILLLTFAIGYEVFSRYLLGAPTTWAFDASYILYGTLFMMAGAYTLSRNGHVRGDFLYRKWSPRVQASLDLVLYIVFFFPGILALIYAGWGFFHLSWLMNERSSFSPDGPILWPFKGLIPLVGVLMLLQGLAEVTRCVICIRTGEWPQRLHDVQELELVILEQAAQKQAEDERPMLVGEAAR
ncbi:TRAP transporter small permease subunit [Arenibaculum pallidiluteum]|uniref:TRAP transporter small permease subunit n=1 Tax=Arenibaculum pallidiluteum TaxID=2812559 RepID=UPI001A957ACD|nr:TRAP transporter small permease subunit [Arenibaculum pallidiluteum]